MFAEIPEWTRKGPRRSGGGRPRMSTYALQRESHTGSRAAESKPHPEDAAYQVSILPAVSRTFALTIPALPEGLWQVVANGYLLCRIADSIEDEPALSYEEKRHFHELFASAVEGRGDAQAFASGLYPLLTECTLEAERDLVENTARIIRITRAFNERQRECLARCVRTMCTGMPRYQERREHRGLRDLDELHDYCYYVAGVVGEMLTELFCDYSSEIGEQREGLTRLAVSFGQGLQMTNILKDIWEDLERDSCWLPRELFQRAGFDLDQLSPGQSSEAFEAGLGELIAIAHGHLRDALDYTLLIPPHERGIRRFCLWALGMAILTLKKINSRRGFGRSSEVKITRRSVKGTIMASNLCLGSDRGLRLLFGLSSRGLPPSKDQPQSNLRQARASDSRASGDSDA